MAVAAAAREVLSSGNGNGFADRVKEIGDKFVKPVRLLEHRAVTRVVEHVHASVDGIGIDEGPYVRAARCSARRFADEVGTFDRSSITFAAVERRSRPAARGGLASPN